MALLQQLDVHVRAQAHASARLDRENKLYCQVVPADGTIAAGYPATPNCRRSTCLVQGMHDWRASQYSSASMAGSTIQRLCNWEACRASHQPQGFEAGMSVLPNNNVIVHD